MDDELGAALQRASRGRLTFVAESRTLVYGTPECATLRLVADAQDLRSLMQLLLLVDPPEPGPQTSLEVACDLLLALLDARPDLAARSLAHVRAAVARAIPWSVDAREVAERQADGTRPAARTRPQRGKPAVVGAPDLPGRRDRAS